MDMLFFRIGFAFVYNSQFVASVVIPVLTSI